MFRAILGLHIIFGCLALATFWIPFVVKKGHSLHIQVGKIFIIAISGAAVTAVLLCYLRLVDPNSLPEQRHFVWF